MNTHIKIFLVILIGLLMASCSKFEGIDIKGVKDVKFRGMKDSKIFLNLTFDVNNPNSKKIVIKKFEFKVWLNDRELGKMYNSEKITLLPNTRTDYEVPVEIALRTAADAFKLMGSGNKILSKITIEGYVKGGRFPVTKKIKIPKQPFTNLMDKYKDKVSVPDTLSVGSEEHKEE